MDFIFCIFLSYRNGVLAKRKGQNVAVWVLITFVAYFLAYIIGTLLITALFFRGPFTQDALLDFMSANPVRLLSFSLAGVGGYLLIHYILERMPDMNNGNSKSDN